MPFEIRHGLVKKNILVMGIPRESRLHHVLDTSLNRIRLPGHGIVLPDLTAEMLRARAGDTLTVKPLYPGFDESEVRVARVVPQYLGQTAYMDLAYESSLLDEPRAMNAVLLEVDPARERDLVAAAKDMPTVATLDVKSALMAHFETMFIDFMWIAISFYILFAGIIAFAVIYTSAALSIGERSRELASMRVLGLHRSEIARIVFGEYFTLSVIGILAGIPLGLLMAKGIILAYKSELYTFPYVIYNTTYLETAAAIALFLVLARLACERPLRKLDMVSALKRKD